jgi:hypothetical protein
MLLAGGCLFYYFGGQLFVQQGGVHGQEGFVAAVLDGAFSVAVH